MKLLMITGLGSAKDLASGKKGAFYNTLEEFSKHWDRIDIICPHIDNCKIDNSLKIKNCKLKIFDNVFVHSSPWPLIFHPFWFLKKGVEIYKEQKFDLMTVHEFPPFYNGIGARLLWQRIRVPYVLEIFHIPGYPKPSGAKESIYKQATNFFIGYDAAKARAVRVMNGEVGNFLEKKGVPRSKIKLIPAVYVDLEIFRPLNINKEYDLIFIGRLESNKGVGLLLEAVRNIRHQIPNIKCLIVGDGSLGNDIKLKIENWKLQNNVILYGWAEDSVEISQLINKSKILVMPSYNEGGPRVVVEAMACGVPVLATPVGIVPYLLKNGQGGEIIAWDAEDMARRVSKLLEDHAGYQKYSHSGLEIARKFNRKTAIKNYAEQLKRIIQINE